MGFSITKPTFKKTLAWLAKLEQTRIMGVLERYGPVGVAALSSATPVDTGEASSSWSYKVEVKDGVYKLSWTNSDIAGSVPLVILLQYGHATKDGRFVSGRDFINPAIQPVFDDILSSIKRELDI